MDWTWCLYLVSSGAADDVGVGFWVVCGSRWGRSKNEVRVEDCWVACGQISVGLRG